MDYTALALLLAFPLLLGFLLLAMKTRAVVGDRSALPGPDDRAETAATLRAWETGLDRMRAAYLLWIIPTMLGVASLCVVRTPQVALPFRTFAALSLAALSTLLIGSYRRYLGYRGRLGSWNVLPGLALLGVAVGFVGPVAVYWVILAVVGVWQLVDLFVIPWMVPFPEGPSTGRAMTAAGESALTTGLATSSA